MKGLYRIGFGLAGAVICVVVVILGTIVLGLLNQNPNSQSVLSFSLFMTVPLSSVIGFIGGVILSYFRF